MKKRSLYVAALPLAVALAQTAQADFTPVGLTLESYNHDLIVEKTGPRPLISGNTLGAPTTASMDGGIANTGNTWNEQGYFTAEPAIGIPPAGTTISTNNHQFTFAPSYTASNGIMLDVGYFTNANFRPNTPAAYGALSFLTSGGNGGCVFSYTAHRQDGTTATGEAASPDWFNVANNIGLIANGRVDAISFALNNANSQNPRLYMVDVTLTASTSPITNIAIRYVSGNASGHSVIMAISGAATAAGPFTPILGTGYNADVVVEATAPKRWDLEGLPVATSGSMDGGPANTGFSWFEQGYFTISNTFGLPAAGSVFTAVDAADHQFRMAAAYDQPNALLLNPVEHPAGTMTLSAPAAFTGLSVLTASGGGSTSLGVVTHHQDGSSQSNVITAPDWFNNSQIAWRANGRIQVTEGRFDSINSGNPRLYYVDITLTNTTSPVTSLEFTFLSTANRAAIFGVSGTTGALKPSVTQQPINVTTNTGVAVNFTVGASGTAPLGFQWQKGTNNVFVNIATGLSSTLALNNVQVADGAQYRAIVSNAAGSVTSSPALLTIISPLQDVTQPTDSIVVYQPNGGNFPGGEPPANAINNNTTKYLNFGSNGGSPYGGPTGFIVTPAIGRTTVSGLRFYTANDAAERDPADYVLEGSNDGGTTWSAVSSGPLSLPAARNAAALDIAPLSLAMQQVLFANNQAFSMYRVSFPNVKTADANAMQIGEVEILGVVDNSGFPVVTSQPQSVRVVAGTDTSFAVAASGTPAPTYQWQRTIDGVTTPIPGATTATLNLNNITADMAGTYSVLVSNSVGVATSAAAQLAVISPLADVTQPNDVIVAFGDESFGRWPEADTNAMNAIDDTIAKWQNGGSGFSAPAGFPPFKGPVGLIVTPSAGPTVVSGLRVYTAGDAPERDPGDFILEGSIDAGATYHVIAGGPLALPDERSSDLVQIDPLLAAMQEVLFPNNAAYSSYRLTFTNTRNNNTANSLQIAEIQLLGVTATSVSPALTIRRNADGTLTLTSSMAGILESATTLSDENTVWTNEGQISGSTTITPAAGVNAKYWRVRLP